MANKTPHSLDHIQRKDFSSLKHFPGVTGNPFDVILETLDHLNKIPAILFIIIIFFLSGFLTWFELLNWQILFICFSIDWLLLAFLPKLKISFGQPNSQSFLLFSLRVPFVWLPWPYNLIAQILGSILVIWGFLIEPSRIVLTKQTVHLNNKKDTNPVKFLHIGDLHFEQLGRKEKQLLKLIKLREPNFILFSGDFLNLSYRSNAEAIHQVSELFNHIQKIAPVYYVSGSPAVDLEKSMTEISTIINARHLDNQKVILREKNLDILLIGITCTHQVHKDIEQLKNIENDKNCDLSILLYHSPDIIFETSHENNLDLILSGHTHGGQVRLPVFGALFTGSLYGRVLQSGLYKKGKTLVYITRGIGMEGLGAPRVRFLCRPEITEWTINSKE